MEMVVVTMYVLYLSAHQSHVSAVCAPKRVQGRGTSVGSESLEGVFGGGVDQNISCCYEVGASSATAPPAPGHVTLSLLDTRLPNTDITDFPYALHVCVSVWCLTVHIRSRLDHYLSLIGRHSCCQTQ